MKSSQLAVAAVVAIVTVVVIAATNGPKTAPPPPAYTIPAYAQALNARLAAYAAAVGPHAPAATASANGITLRSVGFELPISDRAFPPGPSADAVVGNCQSCHSPGMILEQPKLTEAEWSAEVHKMITTYKAPVDAKDVPAIVAYLAGLKVAP